MLRWPERTIDVQALFNPAFCGALLWYAIRAYSGKTEKGLPYIFSPIILTAALNSKIREELPATARTRLSSWLSSTPEVRVRMCSRVKAIVPLAREACVFLMRHGAISVDQELRLVAAPRVLKGLGRYSGSEDIEICMEGARIMANMLAGIEDEQTCMAILGLTI